VTFAADDAEFSGRTIGCRRMQGRVHDRHPIFLSESSASSSVSKSDFAFPVTSGIALAASGVPLPNRRKATS
jgi:hypothetical protein